MEVGRKESSALGFVIQVMQASKAYRDTVLWRGTPANLIHDHEGPVRGLVQDGRSLKHLHHKCRLILEEIIRRANSREDLVNKAYLSMIGRHERANLGED